MPVNDTSLLIEGSLQSIFENTWGELRPHMPVMSLIWAIFYIPTNIFILLRSPDMAEHLNSGSALVVPVMMFLSLLGSIPGIALVLLVRERDCEDYNALVGMAFRKIPYYVSTTLAMAFSMIPTVLAGVFLSVLISLGLDSAGIQAEQQLYALMPVIVLFTLFAMLRYSSALPLYLMRDVRNFRAARMSSLLFRANRMKILMAFGLCTALPLMLNILLLFTIESEIINVILGFIMGYCMFLTAALYAGLLNHLGEEEISLSLIHGNPESGNTEEQEP